MASANTILKLCCLLWFINLSSSMLVVDTCRLIYEKERSTVTVTITFDAGESFLPPTSGVYVAWPTDFATPTQCSVTSGAFTYRVVNAGPTWTGILEATVDATLDPLTFFCTVTTPSVLKAFLVAGKMCQAGFAPSIATNPIIGESRDWTISVTPPAGYPSILFPPNSKLILRHTDNNIVDLLDAKATIDPWWCKIGETLYNIPGTLTGNKLELVLPAETSMSFTCTAQVRPTTHWPAYNMVFEFYHYFDGIILTSPPAVYIPPSSLPAVGWTASITPTAGFDVTTQGLPQIRITIVDETNLPVVSDGDVWFHIFPVFAEDYPHSPQIVSEHRTAVRLQMDGSYTIPAGMARLSSGFGGNTLSQLQITMIPGGNFRYESPIQLVQSVSLAETSMFQPVPLRTNPHPQMMFSIQRARTYANPGYTSMSTRTQMESTMFRVPMGQYTPTLYLPQGVTPPGTKGIWQYDGSGTPRPRMLSANAKAVSQHRVYIVGGQILQSSVTADTRRADAVLMDVWMYDVIAGTYKLLYGNQHTLAAPAVAGTVGLFNHGFRPAARHSAAAAVDVDEKYLYLHGGCADLHCTAMFNDVWVFDLNEKNWAHLGGTITPITTFAVCLPNTATPALYGHQMVLPGMKRPEFTTQSRDTVALGLKTTDTLMIFGGATLTPSANPIAIHSRHFASNALYLIQLNIDYSRTTPTFLGILTPLTIIGVGCSVTDAPSIGVHKPLQGLTRAAAEEIEWLPPAAVYPSLAYDPYRQALWVYGGMHQTRPVIDTLALKTPSVAHGAVGTETNPIPGSTRYQYLPAGDSGALSWLWKFNLVSRKWVLISTNTVHSPVLGRGAPRIALSDTYPDGAYAPLYFSQYSHPGGRVLSSLAVDATSIYLSSGLGHALGMVLPAPSGVADERLAVAIGEPNDYPDPTVPVSWTPLSLGKPDGVDPAGEVLELHTHLLYSREMLLMAGLPAGSSTHGLEVLVKVHDSHVHVNTGDVLSTGVSLRPMMDSILPNNATLRDIAREIPVETKIMYRAIEGGKWLAVGVNRAAGALATDTKFMLITIVQRFLANVAFTPAAAGTHSGSETRKTALSSRRYYYKHGAHAHMLSSTTNDCVTLMLRSTLLPVYNPLQMVLPLTYTTYSPNLDDLWQMDVVADAFAQDVPPSVHTTPITPKWSLYYGNLIPKPATHPALYTPPVNLYASGLPNLSVGARAGAVLLAPDTMANVIIAPFATNNVFLLGGFQVHADRYLHYPSIETAPVLPPTVAMVPAPEVVVLDDVWSLQLIGNACVDTQFSYTCSCTSTTSSSFAHSSVLISDEVPRACENSCAVNNCGGQCIDGAAHYQCICDDLLGGTLEYVGDRKTFSHVNGKFCDSTREQDDLDTDKSFTWTLGLSAYFTGENNNRSPGARVGAAVTVDNGGCVWLYGGVGGNTSSDYYLDLWRLCPGSSEWTLVWVSTLATQYTNPDPNDYSTSVNFYEKLPPALNMQGEPGMVVKGALFFGDKGQRHPITGRPLVDENSLFLFANSPFLYPTVWEYKVKEKKWLLRYRYNGSLESSPVYFVSSTGAAPQKNVHSADNHPGVREAPALATYKNKMYMFSGGGLFTSAQRHREYHMDMWVYDTATHTWALLWGHENVEPVQYGYSVRGNPSAPSPSLTVRATRRGVFASGNSPGCRVGAAAAMSPDGRFFYLHGGVRPSPHAHLFFTNGQLDQQKAANLGYAGLEVLEDLWVFNVQTREWAWLGGSLEPASPRGRFGTYVSRTQHDLNEPPPRFMHGMTISNGGYLYLDRGMTVRYVITNEVVMQEEVSLLNDLFMLYLPPLTTITGDMVEKMLRDAGVTVVPPGLLQLPGLMRHRIGEPLKWMAIKGDKDSHLSTLTWNTRGEPQKDFIMEGTFGHTSVMVPGPILFERELANTPLPAEQVATLRISNGYKIYGQSFMSISGTSVKIPTLSTASAPLLRPSTFTPSVGMIYSWGEPCERTICLNGGVCTPSRYLFVDDPHVRCECPANYFGNACQHSFCDLYPCHNGGTCDVTAPGFTPDKPCTCKEGFSGRFCDTPTYVVTPIVHVPTGTQLGPGYHLMSASFPFPVLRRDMDMLLLPRNTRVVLLSGGYSPPSRNRYTFVDGKLSLSATTWVFSEATAGMVDLMRLVATHHGIPYTLIPANTPPQYKATAAPWGSCDDCAHFGARAGHSIVVARDSSVGSHAHPVAEGGAAPRDVVIVFGGLMAVQGPAAGDITSTVLSNQLWEISLATGTITMVNGLAPTDSAVAPPKGRMSLGDYNPNLGTLPRHEVGKKSYDSMYPSARTHHVSQLMIVDGKRWLYVYGGFGVDAYGQLGFLGDLWRLDVTYFDSKEVDGVSSFVANPYYLQWQYLGCSISHVNYVYNAGDVPVGVGLSIAPGARSGCPSARAHAASVRDAQGRLWIVGGVGARGPLDDVWVYDPAVDTLGSWYRIQGTGHSGMNPNLAPTLPVNGDLLMYLHSLVVTHVDGNAYYGTSSYTLAATYAELGDGCTIGKSCLLSTRHKASEFTSLSDAAAFKPDFTRIGALVGAAVSTTVNEQTLLIYGGLARTRTYLPLYDVPTTRYTNYIPGLSFPFRSISFDAKMFLIYTATDLAIAGLKAGDTVSQLAIGLASPWTGSHMVDLGIAVQLTDGIDATYLETIAVKHSYYVTPTSGHVSGGYLTFSGLTFIVPTVSATQALVVMLRGTRMVDGLHSTELSCAPLAQTNASKAAQLMSESVASHMPYGRLVVARRPKAQSTFIEHTFVYCAPAVRIATRAMTTMGPSNRLWAIDASHPTDSLADTTITLVSGSLPTKKQARYEFRNAEEMGQVGPWQGEPPTVAVAFANTHGLHAAVPESVHDWLRRDVMVNLNNLSPVLGSSHIMRHLAGYAEAYIENLSLPPAGTAFTPVATYPSALAFSTLFATTTDAVYVFGGASMLQAIDSVSNPSQANTFSISATNPAPTNGLPTTEHAALALFGNPYIYSFNVPIAALPSPIIRPELLSITFSVDYTTIAFDFSKDTNTPSFTTSFTANTCTMVLNPASIALITESSRCAWTSRRRLTVQLHERHKVALDSVLGINARTVYGSDLATSIPAVALSLRVFVPVSSPPQVTAVITPVTQSTPCVPLLLSAAGSTGTYGQRLLHKWSIELTATNAEYAKAFDDMLAAMPSDPLCLANYPGQSGICASEIRLSPAMSAAVFQPNSHTTFRLTVTNRFGYTHSTSVTIFRVDDAAPTITLERFQYRKEFNAPLLLAATVTATRCPLSPAILRRSLDISWTLVSGTNPVNFTDANEVVLNGYNLVMVPYGLWLGNYTFTATIAETHYDANGVSRVLSTTTPSITVEIFTTAPTATLTGAVDRTVSLRYLRNNILARDIAVPNVITTDTPNPSIPAPIVTVSAATSTDPTANPAITTTPTIRFQWQCVLSDGSTPCFSELTTADGSLASLPADTHTLRIAATTIETLAEAIAASENPDNYVIFTVIITRIRDNVVAQASSWLRIDRATDISVSLSLSSPHTTTSAALIHSQPHDMVVSATLSSSTNAAEDPDAVLPVLRWYSDPPLNFTDIARALSRPTYSSDLVIPSSYLLPNTRYAFYVHLFDVAAAPPADAYLDDNGVPVSTSTAFATTSLAVFVEDFPALGECELTTLGPYAPMASLDLQTLNATTCESGLCRLRASCRDWPESSVFEWLLQTDRCTKQHSTATITSISGVGVRTNSEVDSTAHTTRARSLGFGHRSVSSITDDHNRRANIRTMLSTSANEAGCSDTVQIAPGTAASAIEFVASIDNTAELLIRISLQKAVRYVSLPLPEPAPTATVNTTAVLMHVEAVLEEVEQSNEDEATADTSTFAVARTRLHTRPRAPTGYRVRTNGVIGAGATGAVSPTVEVSTEQLQVLLSGANVINALLAAPTPTPKPGGKSKSLKSSPHNVLVHGDHVHVAAEPGAGVYVDEYDGDTDVYANAHHTIYSIPNPAEKKYTKSELLLLQQRVLRVLTSDATNLATYGAMSPTHSTAQDLINSASSSSSVVSEATLRAIAAPCTNPTTAYARVHCTDVLVRAFTAYSARNIQEGVPTEVADSVLQRLAAIYDNFNTTTLTLSPARVLKPYTLADYTIDPTSLSTTPQRATPLPEDGSLTEADAALQRAHWEAVRISQQLLAAAKTAAFGDVALRQPESPPRLLVSDSISVLVDAQYVSSTPTSIAIGSDFSVTLPTDLPSMLAAPATEPFMSDYHANTTQGRRGAVAATNSMTKRHGTSVSIAGGAVPAVPVKAMRGKQHWCASQARVTQTLHDVLSLYCANTEAEETVDDELYSNSISTTSRGVTATRTTRTRLAGFANVASVDGLVPVTPKGTTLTKTLTSIISTAPALMRLVSADNRNDTHVASSSVVDVTMYNHTDARGRGVGVDAMGLTQVQPLKWNSAPDTGLYQLYYVNKAIRASATATTTTASVGMNAGATTTNSPPADTSPSHFFFTFAFPTHVTAALRKLKNKPTPRCQFFLPTGLTDGVTVVDESGKPTSNSTAPTVGEWATEGCELVSVTATHATCKCSHLTYFRISFSLDDLFPSINLLSWDDFANLTWANLMKYPAPLITCLVWLGVLCVLVAVAWAFDIYYDKRGLVELAEQWNKVMIASTDLSYVPSRAVVLDYKRYGLPQTPKDFDMCEYMLMSQYDQLGQWYVDVDALSMDQRQRKAAMKARAATVRANDAHAIAAAKAAVAAVNEMCIEEGNEKEEEEMIIETEHDIVHEDGVAEADVGEVYVGLPDTIAEEEEDEDAGEDEEVTTQAQELPVEGFVLPTVSVLPVDEPVETEDLPHTLEAVVPVQADADAEAEMVEAEAVMDVPTVDTEPIANPEEDEEEYDVVDDDVFDAMFPNTDTSPLDTPAEAPAAMVVETMSEDDMLIHSTAFDAPAAPRRPGRLTISRSAYNERMKAKAKAKPPAQNSLHQNRLFAAPYYAGAILAPSASNAFTPFDANATSAEGEADTTATDGPLANPPPPPAHAQPPRGSVAALRRPTMSYPVADSTTSKRASVSAYPANSSATSKRASMSNAVYPGATSTTGRRSIATVPYVAAGLADEGAPVFVTMTSVETGMDAPYAKNAGRDSMSAPPAFFATKSVDTTTKAANRRASVVPPRPSLFSRPAFARPLTLRASVVAPESKAAVAASTRATFPLLTLPPPRPPAGQSDWREVGSTFGEKMKSDHPLLTLFLRSPTDDITFTGHVVMLMLMVLSGLAISAFFTENDEHEIIKDFIVGLITACLLMPVMVVLRYAIVENNHQRLVGFLQWYAELCCFLRYEQVKLLHLGLEAAVPFGDGDEELVSMIKMAIRKQRIEERERKEKELHLQQHVPEQVSGGAGAGQDGEGVEMISIAADGHASANVEACADASGKEGASGDKSDADSEVSTFTPAHTRCECCNSTISCSFKALPPMYRLQLLPHSAYEQIATVAQLGEAALQRVPCRGEVEMREEQLLNELALLGAWDDLLAARAQDRNSVRVAVNKVQWREWLRWAEDTAVALGGDDDADDAITATFNTTSTVSTSATNAKPKPVVHEEEASSLLYNREEAAYRAELLHSRVDWTRSIGLSSGDADDETDVSDVVWIDTGVTPAVDATATALAITAAAAKTRKTRKTTVPAPSSTATAAVTANASLGRSIAASLCPAPALGWGIAPGLGGVPNENESVTVDTTFTMQHLPALDEQAAQHYGNAPATSTYNYANGPASPRASDATLPASPRSSNAVAVAAAPVIGGTATPGSPRVSSATVAGAPRGSPSVSRASSTVTPKTANPALSLLHDPLPQLPVAVTAQRHNHIPSSAAVPLSPLPPPNPLVGPGPSLVQTSATARAQLLAALRQHTRIHIPHLLRFYDAYMPVMPRSVKGKLSVAFLVFWTLLCGFLVVVYGLQFDLAAAEAGDEGNDFDFGKDAGEAESAGEWILNGLFGVALELVIYAPILLLMDACVEARVQKKRERERAAWEYEQAAAIFNDTLQPSDDADAAEDTDIDLHGTSSDAGVGAGAGAGCGEVEMVDMGATACTTKADLDDTNKAAIATYPLASPVAPPLPLPSLALASSSASASTETLTTPTHTSSAPCSPVPTSTLPRATSSSPPTNQARRRTSSAASSTAAGPSRSMERYRSLTERPDLTSADQRLMAVLQRMQIDFAPHRFFAAAALEYPLESAFPILGHMRADTFLRLCANKMKWSAASVSGNGVHHPKNSSNKDSVTTTGSDGRGSVANAFPNPARDAKPAPVVASVGEGAALNISGVSWLNDKHSKRNQRKKQSDARRSKVSIAVDGSKDADHAQDSSVATLSGTPITMVLGNVEDLYRSDGDEATRAHAANAPAATNSSASGDGARGVRFNLDAPGLFDSHGRPMSLSVSAEDMNSRP